MKNIKNTFDLSLDIPLYGDINKLNFCNEYELNHYCFYDDGGDSPSGEEGDDADSAAEGDAGDSGDSGGDSDAGSTAEFGGSEFGGTEFGGGSGLGSFGHGVGYDNTIAAEMAHQAFVTDQASKAGDPEEDVVMPFGIAPVGTTPSFGFLGKTDFENAKRGSTNPGYSGIGSLFFQTDWGRGEFADLVGETEPGSFNIGDALATAVNVFTGLPIGTGLQMGYNALTDNTGLAGVTGFGTGPMGAVGNMMGVFEVDPDEDEDEEGLTSLDVTEDFYDDDVYGSPDIIDTITPYVRNPYAPTPYVRKPYVRNPNIRYRNPNIRYADEGGLVSLDNGGSIGEVVKDQTTNLIDIINTGQAIPPNIGATQAQGSMQPMQANQPNQQNVYTQSAQPQSFYAQPQQVKNYGNLY